MATSTQYRGKSLEHKIHHLKKWATKQYELTAQGAGETKEGRREIATCNRQITKIMQSISGQEDYDTAEKAVAETFEALRNQ